MWLFSVRSRVGIRSVIFLHRPLSFRPTLDYFAPRYCLRGEQLGCHIPVLWQVQNNVSLFVSANQCQKLLVFIWQSGMLFLLSGHDTAPSYLATWNNTLAWVAHSNHWFVPQIPQGCLQAHFRMIIISAHRFLLGYKTVSLPHRDPTSTPPPPFHPRKKFMCHPFSSNLCLVRWFLRQLDN